MCRVPDEEMLYRRIRDEDNHVAFADGRYIVSGQAFSDRERKPSVDIATLCIPLGGPTWTQAGEDNGVARLKAEAVRALVIVGVHVIPPPRPPNTKKEVDVAHAIDVHPCPVAGDPALRDNPAHAEIRPSPDWCSKNVFRRLLEALERIASVEILPKSQRSAP